MPKQNKQQQQQKTHWNKRTYGLTWNKICKMPHEILNGLVRIIKKGTTSSIK